MKGDTPEQAASGQGKSDASKGDGPGQAALGRGAVAVGLAVVLGLSLVGFAVGTGGPKPARAPIREIPPVDLAIADAPPARSYRELRERTEPGRHWEAPQPVAPADDNPDAYNPQDEASRAALRATRAELRAYDGAPPVVPHPISVRGLPECLACHGVGLVIKGRATPIPSHTTLTSCTQCHVPGVSNVPGEDPPGVALGENTFVGYWPPLFGERAWEMAPPTIPHHTLMRENCLACHGPARAVPVPTTHPWRRTCTQCHASSASLDQAPMAER